MALNHSTTPLAPFPNGDDREAPKETEPEGFDNSTSPELARFDALVERYPYYLRDKRACPKTPSAFTWTTFGHSGPTFNCTS